MGHKKDFDMLRTQNQKDSLQWETAKELGKGTELRKLEFEVSQTKGLKERVEQMEDALDQESLRKTELNLNNEHMK